MNENIIFYHKNCNDGFISSRVVNSKFKNSKNNLISLGYGSELNKEIMNELSKLQNPSDTNIIFVDFSPDEETSKYFLTSLDKYKSIIIIDHHKTFAEKFVKLFNEMYPNYTKTKIDIDSSFIIKLPPTLYFYFDVNMCGSTLAYKVFNEENEIPMLLKHIEDRDIWLNKLQPYTDYIAEAISCDEKFIEDKFNNNNIYEDETLNELKIVGEHYSNYKKHLVDKTINDWEKHKTYISINGNKIPAINYQLFQSEIGSEVAKKVKEQICCIYNVNLFKNEVVISFRSTNKTARKYAELLGGGGHDDAAGAKIKVHEFKKLILN